MNARQPSARPIDMSDAGAKAALLDGLPQRRRRPGRGRAGPADPRAHRLGLRRHPVGRAASPQAHLRGVEKMLDRIAAQDSRPLPQARPRRRAPGRRLPALHAAACRHAAPPGRGGAGPLRLRRLLREGQVRRPLGHRILEREPRSAGSWSTPSSTPRQRELFNDRPSIRSTCRAISSWSRATPGSSAAPARPIRRPSASSTCTACGSSPATSSATWRRSTTTRCCRGTSGARWPGTDAELDLPSSTSWRRSSHAPDRHFGELRAAYKDKRVAVPGTVFNAVLNRPDPVP